MATRTAMPRSWTRRSSRRSSPTCSAEMGVLIRAILSAFSVVILIPVAFTVGGGYFPRLPVIGPFGAVLNTGLPWIVGAAALGAGLAGIAVVLGGRKTQILLAVGLVLLGGAGFVGYQYASAAMGNGTAY